MEEEAVVVAAAEAAGTGHRKTSQYNSSTVRMAGEEEAAAAVAPAPFLMAKPEAWPPPWPTSLEEWVEPALEKAALGKAKMTAKDGSLEKSGRSRPG